MYPDNKNGHLPDSTVAQPSLPIKPLSNEESRAELSKAIHDSEEVMAEANTLFPFSFSPYIVARPYQSNGYETLVFSNGRNAKLSG